MTQLHSKRFAELEGQAQLIAKSETTQYSEYSGTYPHIEEDLILGWSVKVKNLLSSACGSNSGHFSSFVEAETPRGYQNSPERLKLMRAVFAAAREDFEGGYLASVRNLVQAEVFSDELEQSKELHKAGYIAPAAVVAGVVLETSLRNLCTTHGIQHGSMDRMNADLAKAGQYNSLTQKRVTALAAIRNSAAHGKVEEYSAQDVKGMIDDVERLLETWLS